MRGRFFYAVFQGEDKQHGLNLHGVVIRGALPKGIEGLLGQLCYPHHRDHGQERQEQQLEEVAEPGMHLAE